MTSEFQPNNKEAIKARPGLPGAGEIMKNRNSGEQFLWQTTAQNLGRSISFELEIPPGGAVPGAHRHPGAVERFKALTRQITLRVEGRGGSTQELALERSRSQPDSLPAHTGMA